MKKTLLFLTISWCLVSIWFGPKKMLGHAEEGIPFYNSSKTASMFGEMWQDFDFGSYQPLLNSRVPTFYLLSLGQYLGAPGYDLQKMLFIALIFLALESTYALSRVIFPDFSNFSRISVALLYVFNLYVMSQVFQRFIYPLIFIWSYLPMFLYLWVQWIETNKKKYLFLFLGSNILYSFVYALSSSVFVLWICAAILWFKKRKMLPAATAFIAWILINTWWWLPLVLVKENPYNSFFSLRDNLTSLNEVSLYYPNSELLLLKQNYFFSDSSIWSKYYSSPLIKNGSWLLLSFVALGTIYCIKSKHGKILVIWLIIGWFLSKGANPPFGKEFFQLFFRHFPVTQVLRNPYEKLGIIFLLPYCLLAAKGISLIFSKKIKTVIIFWFTFILLRPMWTGQVFSGYQIEVPKSYNELNKYLTKRSNFRIFHFPYLVGAGLNYEWGYSGDEPSNFLLDNPTVSKTYFREGDPYLAIYPTLNKQNAHRVFQFFAIDTLILHKDILKSDGLQGNYTSAKNLINNLDKIIFGSSFGELVAYHLSPNLPIQWGYASNNTIKVSSFQDGIKLVTDPKLFTLYKDTFTYSDKTFIIKGTNLPVTSVKKLSPSHYVFTVQESLEPYVLVLLVNFNPSWEANILSEKQFNHFPINGFANGWLIEKKGNYQIDVRFKVLPWD